MAIQVLESTHALTEGSEIWVIPNRKHSLWSLRLDWFMNFQIAKSSLHCTPKPSQALKDLISENELEPVDIAIPTSGPLMISCRPYFPATYLVRLSFTGDVEKWCGLIREAWKDLKKPNLRVFLPTGVDPAAFKTHWGKQSEPVELVADLSSVDTRITPVSTEIHP